MIQEGFLKGVKLVLVKEVSWRIMGRSKATTRRNARKCNSINRDEGAEEPPVC